MTNGQRFKKQFATVSWCVADLAEEYGLTRLEALKCLEEIEGDLEDAMVAAGWDYLTTVAHKYQKEVDNVA